MEENRRRKKLSTIFKKNILFGLNGLKWVKIVQMVQNTPIWSSMVQNGQKRSKRVKNGPYSPKLNKIIQNGQTV